MNLDRFRSSASAPPLPLTALVDVLFLIIIFLVLGADFDRLETIRLPEANGVPAMNFQAVRLELRADGTLWLDGRRLDPDSVISGLRAVSPAGVLLLPDEEADVGPLIRWYDRIRRELRIPVAVGVRSPESGSP